MNRVKRLIPLAEAEIPANMTEQAVARPAFRSREAQAAARLEEALEKLTQA